jgi:outer membrane protein OmpU
MLIKVRPRLVFFFWIATRGKIMKRILLTTTSLILAAGFAHADVTFSGKGEVGVFQDATPQSGGVTAANMTVYSGYDLNVSLSGASDNGITYSMGLDMGAGSISDSGDMEMDAQGATIGTSALTIGYAGVTIVAGQDKNDDLYDDSQNGDVKISGAFGGLGFAAVLDTDSGATSNSFSLSGAAADMTWSLVSTDSNDSGDAAAKITVGYTVNDALSLSFKNDNKGSAAAVNTLGATYAMGSLTLGLSGADDDTTDFSVGYATGPLSAAYSTDESDNWEFNTSYDLGGGASAFATMDASEYTALGMSFAF